MHPDLKQILGELRSELETLYADRLVRVILFGSQARGDAESGSDIDVFVVLKGPVDDGAEGRRMSEFLADISLRYTTVVSCIFMDEDRFLHRNGPLLRNVRREGVELPISSGEAEIQVARAERFLEVAEGALGRLSPPDAPPSQEA